MIETWFGAKLPPWALSAIAVLALLVLAIIFWAVTRGLTGGFRASHSPDMKRSTTSVPPTEIARITEHVVFSVGGTFAVVMLITFNVAIIIAYLSVPNVPQQEVALLGWIGWNILWGIAATIGRRRTYIVRRIVPPSSRRAK